MYSPAAAGSIITACAVMHNIMIDAKYPFPPEDEIAAQIDEPDDDEHVVFRNPIAILNAGKLARSNMIRAHF